MDDHEAWRERAISAGAQPTPVIDRFYFRSIYFREPSGVLFEIATLGPGFTVDEPLEHLGEKLSLPPDYEHLRAEVEPNLRPVVNPRVAKTGVNGNFVWRDAGRVVVFRHDGVGQAAQLLHEHGFADFELLTTPRALPGAPELEAARQSRPRDPRRTGARGRRGAARPGARRRSWSPSAAAARSTPRRRSPRSAAPGSRRSRRRSRAPR